MLKLEMTIFMPHICRSNEAIQSRSNGKSCKCMCTIGSHTLYKQQMPRAIINLLHLLYYIIIHDSEKDPEAWRCIE